MKKLALVLGFFAFLLFIGTVSATTYYCDNCTNCTDAIAGASAGDIIKVTQNFNYSAVYGSPSCQGGGMFCSMYGNEEDCNDDPECSWISPVLDYCIGFAGNNKTFDCQNYTLTGTTNKWGIDADASNSTIRNCVLNSWYYYGIRLAGSSNLLNNIQARNSGSGIYVQYSSKNTINGSNFSYNGAGVYLRTSSLINITNSEFGSNTNGITFVDSSLNIIDNATIKNSDSGLYFTFDSASSTNNTVKNSRIYGCNISINLPYSNYPTYWIYNNMFYNNLLNSTANIYIVDATHQTQYWNVTATSGTNIVGRNQIGGNYWAYPNGTGYSQTCNNTNNDSFCDSSYTFNPTDYLPLTLNQPAAVTLNLTFVSPTPNNGTTINSTSFTANVSSNGTVSSCTFTLDGTNYSMTIASGNLSASKTNSGLSNGKHIYNVTCDGFNSETRTVWVSFGNCTSCSECTEMATNSDTGVTINLANNLTTNDDCITISKPITFDCLLHIIDGNNTGVIGILFTGGQGNLQNCTITKFTLGIYFAATWNNIIQNINVSYNTGQGIVHYGYGQGNSSFNNIIANNNDYGIYVSAVDDIFTNIEANNNTASGVYLTTGAYRSKLISSVTKNNGANGVVIIYFSDCSLQNVTSTNNVGAGLYISQSNVIVNDSHFENNQDSGIHSYYSGNNQFYNNFLNNTANAIFDFSSGSFWNTTIINVINIIGRNQIGGNYWAYPNGTGYSETCDNLNNDSFCDTSYNITDNDIDYIPLTTKYYTPPPPLIDNIGLFSGVALLIMGAGILLFILEGLFSSAGELLRNPKAIVTLLIGAIIMAVMILALI